MSSLNLSHLKAYFYQEDSMSSSSILLSGHAQSIQTRSIEENRCLYKILKHGIFLKSEPCKSRLNSEKTTGNHRHVVCNTLRMRQKKNEAIFFLFHYAYVP